MHRFFLWNRAVCTAHGACVLLQEAAQVWSFLAKVEEGWGVKFPPGSNPGVSFMAHLWEPLRTCHKPLAIHLASEGWGLCLRLLLKTMGFRRAVQQVRPAGSQAARIATGGGVVSVAAAQTESAT